MAKKKHPAQRIQRPRKSGLADGASEASAASEDPVEKALLPFLDEFARLLVAAGITAPKWTAMSTAAFVRAGARLSRLRNSRVNQSAVAAMTGLTRVEVKKLLASKATNDRKRGGNRAGHAALIAGWQRDPDFTDRSGKARPLTRKVGPGSFADLVKRYGADVPAAAMLRELSRRSLVDVAQSGVRLVVAPSDLPALATIQQLSAAMASLLAVMQSCVEKPHQVEATVAQIDVSHVLAKKVLKRHLTKAIPLFLQSAQVAAGGFRSDRKKPDRLQPVYLQILVVD